MEIKENYNLSSNNSFGFNYQCNFFCKANSEDEILEFIKFSEKKGKELIVLGEGTNIVIKNNLDKSVLLIKNKGKEIEKNKVRVAAGENWHEFVLWTLRNNLFGLENLSLIPGSVGAAPIQNIGAYGSEVSEFIESVSVIDLQKKEKLILKKNELDFSYRSSIFKKHKHFIVTEVVFQLNSTSEVNTSYKKLKDYLIKDDINPEEATPQQVCRSVIEIRKSILPNHITTPNVGSFFHNILLDELKLKELVKKLPKLPYFREKNLHKIPTAYLIEEAGWKGKVIGGAKVSEKHSLVLISEEDLSDNLFNLANKIKEDIKDKYGVDLTFEPTIFS